jgi:hypothetical protein
MPLLLVTTLAKLQGRMRLVVSISFPLPCSIYIQCGFYTGLSSETFPPAIFPKQNIKGVASEVLKLATDRL